MILADVLFDISSYWHAGTGRGSGPGADAVVFTTAGGLPCLPGKTVKGLLKEAVRGAVAAGVVDAAKLLTYFGSSTLGATRGGVHRVTELEAERFRTSPGSLRFESAILGAAPEESAAWERWAAGHAGERGRLFHYLASTKLDERGVAADKTLRRIQVAVPMTLRAEVSSDEAEGLGWVSALTAAAPFLDALGSHRNRGLGRVTVRVVQR